MVLPKVDEFLVEDIATDSLMYDTDPVVVVAGLIGAIKLISETVVPEDYRDALDEAVRVEFGA